MTGAEMRRDGCFRSVTVVIHMQGTPDHRVRADSTALPPAAATVALHGLMTAEQVAALLLLPVSTVKDYARRGVLPSIKLGKHRRFVQSQMEATVEGLARCRG